MPKPATNPAIKPINITITGNGYPGPLDLAAQGVFVSTEFPDRYHSFPLVSLEGLFNGLTFNFPEGQPR